MTIWSNRQGDRLLVPYGRVTGQTGSRKRYAILIVLRFSLYGTFVVLSTLMIARPVDESTYASFASLFSSAERKLENALA